MKSLILKMQSRGIYVLGFDIAWQNKLLEFTSGEGMGVFDQANMELLNSEQGLVVVGFQNLTERHITGIQEIAELNFEWADGAMPDVVEFEVRNVTAEDMHGTPVSVEINPVAYEPEGPHTIIDFIWRVTE